MARGNVRTVSRTSPAILLTSHQPPNEKNAPTMAAPNAGNKGKEPERCALKGTKFVHEPRWKASAHTINNPSNPSFNQVIQRKNPALIRMLRAFNKQRTKIIMIAANLMASADQWKM